MTENAVSRIDIDVRSSGVDKAIASLEKLVSVEGSAQVSSDKLAKVKERSETAVDRLAKRYDAEFKALEQLRRDQEALNRAYDAGLGGTKAYELALAGLQKQQTALARAANDNAKGIVLTRHEWINLSRQIQDVGVSLAAGQSPLTVLIQQGSQIGDVFGSSNAGAGAALREFGSAALRFAVHPVTLAAAAAGSATLAYMRWREQVDALTVSLNGLGRQSGLSQFGVNRAAEAGAARAEISNSAARGLAGQFLGAGVPGANIEGAIGISGRFSRGLGMSLEDAGKELASALAAPAKGADELAKKYGLVTFAEREHIKQIAAVGDRSGASAKLLAILSQRIAEMEDPTSRLAKLWERVKGGFFNGLDKFGQFIDKVIDGPEEIARRERERARRSLQGALSARESEEAERAKQINQLREDSALQVREIMARTFAEREAIATARAYAQVMRSDVPDALRASIAVESERAKMLAESARKVEDLVRSSDDQARLSRASNPLERRLLENEFARRDFFRENIPGGATPMAREFDVAGGAARKLADALTQSAGRIDGKIGRLVPLSEWQGGATGAAGMTSAADPRGLSPYIRDRAAAYGIDPEIALRVARSEGLRTFTGDNGTSFGAMQLHVGGGVGDEFRRATGLDPADPKNERATIDFALKIAAQRGWGPWHGAARAGIGQWEGIGGARSPANDNLGGAAGGAFDRNDATFQYEARIKPQEDFAKSIILSNDALGARIATLGMDQRAVDESTKRQELMNEAIRQTGSILPEQQSWIDTNARAWADYQQRAREADEAQRRVNESMDFVRGTARDALGGFVSDLRQGKSAADALNDALGRILDRLIQIAIDDAISGLFGRSGQNGGGLFGGFLQNIFGGIFGGGAGAPMQLSGAALAGGGGGGFIGNLFSGFAGLFAEGGTIPAGKWGIAGERGPEIITGPASVIPAPMKMPAMQPMPKQAGPNIVINNNAPGVRVTPSVSNGEVRIMIAEALGAYDQQLDKSLLDRVEDRRRRAG